MTDSTVTRNDEASRYEIRLGDTLAGFAEFDRRPGVVRFLHTEIDPAFRGRGLAAILTDHAVLDAAADGDAIVPFCPYVAERLRAHTPDSVEVRWPDRTED